jgi:predicted DNA-binding protein (MmcQ/YjbR family)
VVKKKALAGDKALKELRAFGLAYPGAHTKSPWPGHLDLAVNDKTFAYLGIEGEPFSISCKLPRTCQVALLLPFCTPTGYGLGKSGWVTAQFPDGDAPPVELLKQWIDESYRAQAPRKLVKQLDQQGAAALDPARSSVNKRVRATAVTPRGKKRPATQKQAPRRVS